MAIDDNLAMQFADSISDLFASTTESLKADKETTMYGTITKIDSTGTYVRFDGATVDTPVTMSVEAIVGDRVSVLVKNRQAMVTGNITAPNTTMEIGRSGSYRIKLEGDQILFINGSGSTMATMKVDSSTLGNILFLLAEKIGLRASYGNDTYLSEVIAKHGSDNDPQAALQVRNTAAGGTYSGVYVQKNKVDVVGSQGLFVNGSATLKENTVLVKGLVTAKGTIQANTTKALPVFTANVPSGYKIVGIDTVYLTYLDLDVTQWNVSDTGEISLVIANNGGVDRTVNAVISWFAIKASDITQAVPQEIIF